MRRKVQLLHFSPSRTYEAFGYPSCLGVLGQLVCCKVIAVLFGEVDPLLIYQSCGKGLSFWDMLNDCNDERIGFEHETMSTFCTKKDT